MVRLGYQQTEVGEIPEDWGVISIQEALDQKSILDQMDGNHGELYPRSHEFVDHGVPYIGANDFQNGKVTFNSCKYLKLNRALRFKKGIAKDGDVLFAHNATVGPVALLRCSDDFVILSTTATYYRCDLNKIDNYYLKSYFESDSFVKQYWGVMSQSTRNQVPITAQRKFKIILPDIAEQKSIAKALSDVDELIVSLENLIAKKRDIKTATMQQLLTGKKRLPGFGQGKGYKQTELGEIPEDWDLVELGNISKIEMGQSPSSANYNTRGLGLPLIQGNADIRNRQTIIRNYTSQITKRAYAGDIILSVRAPVGEVAIALFDCCIGRGVCAIRYKNDYLYLWLVSFESSWEKYSKGSTFDSINSDELKELKLFLPADENEQLAIADILSDMDKVISSCENRLNKTKAIKQGMMQELLTGRTRLI